MVRQDDRFRSRFQINSDTGISADYFNNILVRDSDVILNPDRYYERGEHQLRETLIGDLRKLRTYSEYTGDVVVSYNAPERDVYGNLHQTQEPVSLDDFIGDENIDRVRELDKIVASMKELGTSAEKLDLHLLIGLMYRASLLIYGAGSEEKLKRRFGIDQK